MVSPAGHVIAGILWGAGFMILGQTAQKGQTAMSVCRFLLPVNSPESAQAALRAGLGLAVQLNAHLEVLHIQPDSRDIAPLAGEGLSGPLIEGMLVATEQADERRAQALQALFTQEALAAQVPIAGAQFGVAAPSARFMVQEGREEQIVAHQARLADLTIVPHPLAGEDVATAEALHAVLFDSGRPVLLVPVQPPSHIGRRVAIAWNGTAYAASALASAMHFICQAEAVVILASDEYRRAGPDAVAVQTYLAQHGVEAGLCPFGAINRNVGAGLLAAAEAFGADLMVMGAYSTASRLRQLILGGVTRHVLQYAELCVLMNR